MADNFRTDLDTLAALCDRAIAVGWSAGRLETVEGTPARFTDMVCRLAKIRGNERTPELSTLHPKESRSARRPSPSATHGMGSFPPHVDGAHHRYPPRIVVLYCVCDDELRPTTLQPWGSVVAGLREPQLLTREVFIFKNGRRSFADTIASKDRPFVRWDSVCMSPATNGAHRLFDDVICTMTRESTMVHAWRKHAVLVIDNWRTLHGRGEAKAPGQRILFRATLD
jgi:hypothetical protein